MYRMLCAGSANTAVSSSATLSGTSFPSTKVWGLLKDTGGSTQINDHKAAKAGSEARGAPSSEEEYKENFPMGTVKHLEKENKKKHFSKKPRTWRYYLAFPLEVI